MTTGKPTDGTSASPPADRARVLLVDDHAEGRSAIAKYLGYHGFDVTEAGTGQAALAAVAAAPPFPFLLLDLSLPDMDGRDVARKVRADSPSTWIALVTGWTPDPDDPDPPEIDSAFVKPVNLADLCKVLRDGPKPGGGSSR
jgi:two-component system OmpR family response regulator